MHVDDHFQDTGPDPVPPGLRTLWLGSPVVRQDRLAPALAMLRGTLPWWHPYADGRAALAANVCVGIALMLAPGTADRDARRDLARGWLWAAANLRCHAAGFNMATELVFEWAAQEPRRALGDLRAEILRWLALATPGLATADGVAAALDMEARIAAARQACRGPAAANDNLPVAAGDGGGHAFAVLAEVWRQPPASRQEALAVARLLSLTMRVQGMPLPRRLAEEALRGTDLAAYDEVVDQVEDIPDRRAATSWRWVAASLGNPRQRLLLLRDLVAALQFAVHSGDGREAEALGDLCLLWVAQPVLGEIGRAGHQQHRALAGEAARRARPRLRDVRRRVGNV